MPSLSLTFPEIHFFPSHSACLLEGRSLGILTERKRFSAFQLPEGTISFPNARFWIRDKRERDNKERETDGLKE